MNKFHKIQKISSIIPFISTIFVAIVTMIELRRKNATKRIWMFFALIFFISGSLVYLLNAFVMTGQHLILNVIVSAAVFAIANLLYVELQIMCGKTKAEEPQPVSNAVYSKKKLAFNIFIAVFFTVGIPVILSAILVLRAFLDTSHVIEDINGDADTSLAVIQIDEILSDRAKGRLRFVNVSSSGEDSGIQALNLDDYDRDVVSYSFKEANGVCLMQATNAKSNALSLKIESTLESGNLEIIVIVDDAFYESVAANETKTIQLTDVENKMILVKFAAESARAQITVTRQWEKDKRGQGDKGTVLSSPSEESEETDK